MHKFGLFNTISDDWFKLNSQGDVGIKSSV